ncbi:MAG: Methionine aminotransferase [Ignavibacteria bacterium]|nr:Methionine aminotransferase [Ignavibacteria bacterium]
MTALANKHNAINLSQGFPDFPVDPLLNELTYKAIRNEHNQYAPMAGLMLLKEGISEIIYDNYSRSINPDTEITITSGATEALFAAISAVIKPGDEVIMFDPSYDSYEPAVLLNGGVCVRISLEFPEYKINWAKVNSALTKKTRMIIINSPNNPACSVVDANDIAELKNIISGNEIYLLSDEVYEHIVFDGKKHLSFISDEDLFNRSFVVSSFGKTYHITGWKVGYCTAPEYLTSELRKVHQFLTFSTSTPFQHALSEYIKDKGRIKSLKKFYQDKRNYFLELIKDTKFKPLNCSGTYFQLLDYSDISKDNDVEFALHLTEKFKIASIPVSVFYKEKPDHKVLRFCFAKKEETLERAAENLKKAG